MKTARLWVLSVRLADGASRAWYVARPSAASAMRHVPGPGEASACAGSARYAKEHGDPAQVAEWEERAAFARRCAKAESIAAVVRLASPAECVSWLDHTAPRGGSAGDPWERFPRIAAQARGAQPVKA